MDIRRIGFMSAKKRKIDEKSEKDKAKNYCNVSICAKHGLMNTASESRLQMEWQDVWIIWLVKRGDR